MMDSRYGAFNQGMSGGGDIATSMSAASARFMSMVPHGFNPNSVLQPYMRSTGNGNSATDAARQTPSGQLPSMNGMSAGTYGAMTPQFGTRLIV